jgi:predicted Fe-Mo cluster-binding NifX family protein
MKIALATNDRETIAQRTGQAKEFVIVELDDNFNELKREYKRNHHEHHSHDDEGGHMHSHAELIELLEGVEFVCLKMVGKHLKADLDNAGIKIVKVGFDTIDEVVNDLHNIIRRKI